MSPQSMIYGSIDSIRVIKGKLRSNASDQTVVSLPTPPHSLLEKGLGGQASDNPASQSSVSL